MDIKKLLKLIKKEEGTKLDFKQLIDVTMESGKKELTKDICAIANTNGGRGYIVFGVEDKTKKILGVDKNLLKEEQVQQIISSRCEPPIPIKLEYVRYKNKCIGVITIFDNNQKPYQVRDKGSFYIRRGSTTDIMRKHEIISAAQEGLNFNLELCPVVKSDIECLDDELINKYFTSHGININNKNRIILMENTSIVSLDKESGQYRVTLGGLLIFCKSNYLYIPQNMIRIVNKINPKVDEITIVQGDLISMLDKSLEVLLKVLPKFYPVKAIHEGVKNAVVYRDYNVFYKEIEVVINYNSVSITSPGIIMKNSKDLNYHNYTKRNMWLYEKLISMDNKKRFIKSGRGFIKMKKAFKNHGKVIFVNDILNNSFKVIYPGITKFK